MTVTPLVKRGLYALLAVAVLGLASWLIYGAAREALVYFILPSEYAQASQRYEGRRLRLGGLVKPDTVTFDDKRLELRFVISDSIQDYPVVHFGSPPNLFQEDTGVVVEGYFRDGQTFESDTLLIKHSEVYQPPKDGEIDVQQLKESLE